MALPPTKKSAPKRSTVSSKPATKPAQNLQVEKLEAKCAVLEDALSKALDAIKVTEQKVAALEAAAAKPAPVAKSAAGEDPRVDELLGKLRALVSKCRHTRGKESQPWPRF